MPTLNIKDYILAGLLVVIIIMGFRIAWDKAEIALLSSEVQSFKTINEANQIKIAALEKAEKTNKEVHDEKLQSVINISNANIERMRLEYQNSNRIKSFRPPAGKPDQLCFARENFVRTMDDFDAGTEQIVTRCTDTEIRLNNAAEWATEMNRINQPTGE